MSGDLDQLGRVVGGLIVVLVVLALIARVARRARGEGGGPGLRIVERIGLSRDANLALVEISDRKLLLGVTSQGVTMLADIEGRGDIPGEIVRPPLPTRRSTRESSPGLGSFALARLREQLGLKNQTDGGTPAVTRRRAPKRGRRRADRKAITARPAISAPENITPAELYETDDAAAELAAAFEVTELPALTDEATAYSADTDEEYFPEADGEEQFVEEPDEPLSDTGEQARFEPPTGDEDPFTAGTDEEFRPGPDERVPFTANAGSPNQFATATSEPGRFAPNVGTGSWFEPSVSPGRPVVPDAAGGVSARGQAASAYSVAGAEPFGSAPVDALLIDVRDPVEATGAPQAGHPSSGDENTGASTVIEVPERGRRMPPSDGPRSRAEIRAELRDASPDEPTPLPGHLHLDEFPDLASALRAAGRTSDPSVAPEKRPARSSFVPEAPAARFPIDLSRPSGRRVSLSEQTARQVAAFQAEAYPDAARPSAGPARTSTVRESAAGRTRRVDRPRASDPAPVPREPARRSRPAAEYPARPTPARRVADSVDPRPLSGRTGQAHRSTDPEDLRPVPGRPHRAAGPGDPRSTSARSAQTHRAAEPGDARTVPRRAARGRSGPGGGHSQPGAAGAGRGDWGPPAQGDRGRGEPGPRRGARSGAAEAGRDEAGGPGRRAQSRPEPRRSRTPVAPPAPRGADPSRAQRVRTPGRPTVVYPAPELPEAAPGRRARRADYPVPGSGPAGFGPGWREPGPDVTARRG